MMGKKSDTVAIETDKPLYCEPSEILESTLIELVTFDINELKCNLGEPPNNTVAIVQQPTMLPKPDSGFSLSEITPLVTLIGGVFVIYKFIIERKEARIAKKIEKYEDHLRKFYGPLKELREESKILYEIFGIQVKKEFESGNGNTKRFRTLGYLRGNKPSELPKYDQELLKHIISLSKKNIELIEEHGGAIDSPALSSLFGKLCAHFRVMEVAAEGNLLNAPKKLEDVVFPLETDGAIDNEIKKINCKLDKLRNTLSLKARIYRNFQCYMTSPTIKFYDDHADSYYRETNHVDMKESYIKFRDLIQPGGRILDAGCGVGRDTRFFISKGYKVQSFDLSEKMCEITRMYPFSFCTKMSFMDVDFYEEYDAVWANASLLHVSPKDMPTVLEKLTTALKVGGYLFASFKTKTNFTKKDSREFYFHNASEIKQFIEAAKLGLEEVEHWISFKGGNPDNEEFESYIWVRKG